MIQTNTQAPKTALVTGGARRIGKAIVQHLHRQGYRVAVHCHQSLQEAQALVNSLNAERTDSAAVFVQDLQQPDTVGDLIARVLQWSGRLDLLVNNASVFFRTEIHAFSAQAIEILFAVNVWAPYALSIAAHEALMHAQGSIVNITDIHAQSPLKGYGLYCQSKSALWMQTQSLAKELAPEVRVNAVAPGAIAWPEADNQLDDSEKQQILAKTPLKRHGNPEDIASAVFYFAENQFVTGQKLHIDGGRSL